MKYLLTHLLMITTTVLSAQTAVITLSAIDNSIAQLANPEQFTPTGTSDYKLPRLNVQFQEENPVFLEDRSTTPVAPRIIETHSETWAIRDPLNLSLQINQQSTHHISKEKMAFETRTMQIYDVLGRIVVTSTFEADTGRITLDHLSEGIYYLILVDEQQKPLYSQKLAIK